MQDVQSSLDPSMLSSNPLLLVAAVFGVFLLIKSAVKLTFKLALILLLAGGAWAATGNLEKLSPSTEVSVAENSDENGLGGVPGLSKDEIQRALYPPVVEGAAEGALELVRSEEADQVVDGLKEVVGEVATAENVQSVTDAISSGLNSISGLFSKPSLDDLNPDK